MKPSTLSTSSLFLRSTVAVGAIFALILIFAHEVFPNTPSSTVLFTATLGMVGIFTAACLLIIVKATINQFILKQGGIDTAWLWFNSKPEALEANTANKQISS